MLRGFFVQLSTDTVSLFRFFVVYSRNNGDVSLFIVELNDRAVAAGVCAGVGWPGGTTKLSKSGTQLYLDNILCSVVCDCAGQAYIPGRHECVPRNDECYNCFGQECL